ncbi:MAG: HAMP domain-containing sensor histidine kinase [Bacillota bacterium]
MKSFLAVILITVSIFEAILLVSIRQYYFGNVEAILSKQAEISSNFYSKYFAADGDLKEKAKALAESLSASTSALVQIVGIDSRLLADSVGGSAGRELEFPDVKKALEGVPARWTGRMPKTGERVLAISYPLKAGVTVVGAVRFVTSLEKVNQVVTKIALSLVAVGLAAVIVSIFAAFVLSGTIVRPLRDISRAAMEMAKGNFEARARKRSDDEIGSLADTLNFMAEEIERQEKLKNEFIASVSHELRTPLTAIKGWAVTLLSFLEGYQTENVEELKEGLEIISSESERLSELVDELLDFSRLQSGRIKLKLEKVSLSRTLDYIKAQMMPRARRQGVEFQVACDSDLPEITADENRIKQVLINLLDNAFKFTEPGGEVRLSARGEGGFVRVTVEDTGCGIAEKDLPHVTEKFYKADSRQPGSGLGLAICQEIAKLHGGRLEIESRQGEGTRVSLILPV